MVLPNKDIGYRPAIDPIINKHTEQVKKTRYGFIMACIELHDTGQPLYHTEKQGFGYTWLSK